jgi:hypothetical protein
VRAAKILRGLIAVLSRQNAVGEKPQPKNHGQDSSGGSCARFSPTSDRHPVIANIRTTPAISKQLQMTGR